ncbi:MAG: hypothetical protein JXA53_10865 [Bacteroidales bacterium]|nr:hypothetical protein [Bacteroidales bacterium]
MFEFLRSLVSNQLYAIIAVVVIWIILFIFLYIIKKIKSYNWIRLEYIWILIGFWGVLTIIDDNKKEYSKQNLKFVNTWIDRDYEAILSTSSNQYHCMQFNYNSDYFTKLEFDSIQNRQDLICQWNKEMNTLVDSCYKLDKPSLTNLPLLSISNPEEVNSYSWIMNTVKNINENVVKREELNSTLNSERLLDLKSGAGVILLFFAFGLRLTIITYKVRKEKNKA